MSAQILPELRAVAMRRLALAIGISFFVLSATTLGADLRTADPSAVATALAGRHATVAHPTDPPAINAKTPPDFVDGLYKELMEWTPPPCLSATNDASLRGR
jgi:hypothetical protein